MCYAQQLCQLLLFGDIMNADHHTQDIAWLAVVALLDVPSDGPQGPNTFLSMAAGIACLSTFPC
jgi:hypothetical protein